MVIWTLDRPRQKKGLRAITLNTHKDEADADRDDDDDDDDDCTHELKRSKEGRRFAQRPSNPDRTGPKSRIHPKRTVASLRYRHLYTPAVARGEKEPVARKEANPRNGGNLLISLSPFPPIFLLWLGVGALSREPQGHAMLLHNACVFRPRAPWAIRTRRI